MLSFLQTSKLAASAARAANDGIVDNKKTEIRDPSEPVRVLPMVMLSWVVILLRDRRMETSEVQFWRDITFPRTLPKLLKALIER